MTTEFTTTVDTGEGEQEEATNYSPFMQEKTPCCLIENLPWLNSAVNS